MSDDPVFRNVNVAEESVITASKRLRVRLYIEWYPLRLAMIVGGLFALLFPALSMAFKIIMCNYGWTTDYSGVLLVVPPFVGLAVFLGLLVGGVGMGIGNWYSHIAPVSWLVQHDVEEGRENLNFSEWGVGREGEEGEEMAESLLDGEMPLPIFLITHPEARLSESEKQLLAQGLLATGGGENEGEDHGSSERDSDGHEEGEDDDHDDDD